MLALVETTPAEQLHRLFHDYIERMLRRVGARVHATAQQTKHWLTWLAYQLTEHQQTEFYLEYLRPDWLPERRRSLHQWSLLIVGSLYGLIVGRLWGLVVGLVIALVGWSIVRLELEIPLAELLVLIWPWKIVRQGLLAGLFLGLAIGLVFGLLLSLLWSMWGPGFTERLTLSPNEGMRHSGVCSWLEQKVGIAV